MTGSLCIWQKAWIGRCNNPATENGRCVEHQIACCSCGSPATHDCPETGQFVCGAPLCDDCEHTTFEDGSNGGVGFNSRPCPDGMQRHVRMVDQRFSPWCARANETQDVESEVSE